MLKPGTEDVAARLFAHMQDAAAGTRRQHMLRSLEDIFEAQRGRVEMRLADGYTDAYRDLKAERYIDFDPWAKRSDWNTLVVRDGVAERVLRNG